MQPYLKTLIRLVIIFQRQQPRKKHPLSWWIWNHGTLSLEKENKYWACNLCPDKSNPQWYQIPSGTRAAALLESNSSIAAIQESIYETK